MTMPTTAAGAPTRAIAGLDRGREHLGEADNGDERGEQQAEADQRGRIGGRRRMRLLVAAPAGRK